MSFAGGLGGGGTGLGEGLIRIGAVTNGLRGQVRGAVRQVQSELQAGARQIETQGRAWNRAFGIATAGVKVGVLGVAAAFGAGLAASISYEQAFAGVIKTTGAAPAVLDKLRKAFRQMSTEIPISANELAQLGETAGALGIPVKNIEQFVRVTALIGKTTNVSADQAATSLGQLSNVLGLTGKDYERFASTLVDLGNKGASTEAQILEIASRAGAVGHNIGLSNQAILAFSSSIANLGIESEAGGTALQFLFQRLSAMLANKGKLQALADVAGVTGKQFKKGFVDDAQGAIITFLRGLGKLDPIKQAVALQTLGLAGARTSRTYVGLAASIDKNLIPALNVASDAWKANTALQNAANIKFDTTASKITILKNRITNILIGLGDAIRPAFTQLITWLSDTIPKAAEYLGRIWDSTLGPAAARLGGSIAELGSALGKVFGFGQTTQAGQTEGALDGIADSLANVADAATTVLHVLSQLVANPVIGGLLKIGAALAAVSLAFSGARALVGRLNSGTMSLLRATTFGRIGAPAVAAQTAQETREATATAKQDAAATEMAGAAREHVAAATALKGAAAALTARDLELVGLKHTPNMGGPIQYVGEPGLATSVNGRIAQEARAAEAAAAEQAAVAAETTVRNTTAAYGSGLLNAVRSGGSGLMGLARGAIGAAGKVFWPLMIAQIGMEILKAPIGDLIEANTAFKRAGAEMKQDFIGGVIDLFTKSVQGADAAVGRADTMTIGGAKIGTVALAKIGIDNATFDRLEAPVGSIANAQGNDTAVAQTANALAQRAGESTGDWFKRIQDLLPAATVAAAQKYFRTDLVSAGKAGASRVTTLVDSAGLGQFLAEQTSHQVATMTSAVTDSYRKALHDELLSRGFTAGQVGGLTQSQLRQLSTVAQFNASGQWGFIEDLLVREFVGGVKQKTSGQITLSADAQAAVKSLATEFGKGWQTSLSRFAVGGFRATSRRDRSIEARLSKLLGDDWQTTLRNVYRQLRPQAPRGTPGGFTQDLRSIQKAEKQSETAIHDFYESIPADVEASIQQTIATSGETDPAIVAEMKANLEAQWRGVVRAAIEKFTGLSANIDPAVVTNLQHKFGKDWIEAFRGGAEVLGKSKGDQAIAKELARVFGPQWKSTLTEVGKLVFAQKGGADTAGLKKLLAQSLSRVVSSLKPEDLAPTGGKTPGKNASAKIKADVQKTLTDPITQAALESATSPDAEKAKQGYEDLGNAFKKNIPDDSARARFVGSLLALQKAANTPNLDKLGSVLNGAIPSAANAIDSVASSVQALIQKAIVLARITGGHAPAGGGGHNGPGGGGSRSSGSGSGGATGSGGSTGHVRGGATGLVFDTRGETTVTTGEAGSEHVAVLRNFKRMRLPAMPGMQTNIAAALAGLSPAGMPRAHAVAGAMGGPRVAVHANTLQLLSPADRQSVDAQLAFLAPDER